MLPFQLTLQQLERETHRFLGQVGDSCSSLLRGTVGPSKLTTKIAAPSGWALHHADLGTVGRHCGEALFRGRQTLRRRLL